jgi:hypothetical protein
MSKRMSRHPRSGQLRHDANERTSRPAAAFAARFLLPTPMAPRRSVVLLLLAAIVQPSAARYEPIPFPGACQGAATTGSTYFDISAVSCLPCPSGQEPDIPRTSCICTSGSVLDTSTTPAACVACGAGTAPTRDRSACMPCLIANDTCPDATLGLNGGECECPSGRVLVERDGHGGLLPAKRCLPCPTGTYVAGPAECRACPAENMEASTTGTGCNCLTGYVNYAHTNGFWGRDRTCVESSAYTQVSPYYSSAGALEMFYQDLPVSHPPTDTQPTTRPTTPTRPPMRLAATPCATDGCCPRVRSQSSQGSTLTVTESLVLKQLLLPAGAACLTAITADTTCAPFHEPPHRSQNGALWPPIARSAPTVRPL